MKKILAAFFYFVLICGTVWGHIPLPIPQDAKVLLKDYVHSVNEFGNLLIDCEKVDAPTLEHLKKIKKSIATNWNKRGIILAIPISESGLGSSIEDIGFELYILDSANKRISYIFRNNRDIPNIHAGYTAGSIFIYRYHPVTKNKELLVLNEYDKEFLTVPGGCSARGELMIDTILRETVEEVGIRLNKKNIHLSFVTNRVYQKDGATFVNMGFETMLTEEVDVRVDNNEVLDYAWVEVSKLKDKDFTLFGKKLFSLYYTFLFEEKVPGRLISIADNHMAVAVK